jgi:hypothetical protein
LRLLDSQVHLPNFIRASNLAYYAFTCALSIIKGTPSADFFSFGFQSLGQSSDLIEYPKKCIFAVGALLIFDPFLHIKTDTQSLIFFLLHTPSADFFSFVFQS